MDITKIMEFKRGVNPHKKLKIGIHKKWRTIYVNEFPKILFENIRYDFIDFTECLDPRSENILYCQNCIALVPGFPDNIKGFDKNKDLILESYKDIKDIIVN